MLSVSIELQQTEDRFSRSKLARRLSATLDMVRSFMEQVLLLPIWSALDLYDVRLMLWMSMHRSPFVQVALLLARFALVRKKFHVGIRDSIRQLYSDKNPFSVKEFPLST